MATKHIRIDVVDEVLRGLIGGKEYEEGRGPEVAAIFVKNHEDSNALMQELSHWLRDNFHNEYAKAVTFGLARLMKLTNNRGAMIAGEALEALPRIAEELQTLPEMKRGTPDEKRARFGDAIAAKFTQTYKAVSSRFNNIPATGGYMPKVSEVAQSVLLSLSAAGEGLSAGAKTLLKEGAEATLLGARFVMFLMGAAALWCLFAVIMTIFVPASIYYIAWISLVIFVGGPALLMMIGAAPFKNGIGTLVQAVSTTFLMFWTSTMELVTFALAAGRGITMQQGHWDINFMLVVILVVWDRAVMALTQRLIGIPGSELQKFWAKLDGKYTDEEKKANDDYWKKQIFLTGISVSVCVAVNVAVIMILGESYRFNPIDFDLFIIAAMIQLLLAATYVRKNIALWRDGDSGPYMNEYAKKWNGRYFTGAQWTQWLVPTLALIVIIGGHYIPDSWGTNVGNGTVRAAEVVGYGGDKVLDYAEKAVGVPKTQEAPEVSEAVVVEAPKPKTKTKAEKAAAIKKYCDENPIDRSSTCKK